MPGHMLKAHPAPSEAPERSRPGRRLSRRGRWLAAATVLMLVLAGTAFCILKRPAPPAPGPEPVTPGRTDYRTIPTAYVSMETDSGGMLLALYGNATPETVGHFLVLAASDFYNGTIFHVAIKDQFIAGGGYLTNLSQKVIALNATNGEIPAIPLEINPVIKNTAGTLGMIHNSTDTGSAVSEFYINLADNPSLDKSPTSPGFSVFGRVLSGIEVARGIGNLTTSDQRTPGGATLMQVPVKHVRINHVIILTADK